MEAEQIVRAHREAERRKTDAEGVGQAHLDQIKFQGRDIRLIQGLSWATCSEKSRAGDNLLKLTTPTFNQLGESLAADLRPEKITDIH
eukprot:g20468.t1